MSYTSPLLFDVIDGQGAATLNVSQALYRQAREVMDRGHRLAIRARPKARFELSVRREYEPLADHPITLTTSGNTGIELHDAAERLIAHAHSLLFDPLPW
jgi:hypothetical protein